MKKFESGKQYSMTSICNHECIWAYTVTARTEKTITLTDGKETLKRRINQKISEYSNTETVPPLGQYSMACSLTA
jgi:hypothetical protein